MIKKISFVLLFFLIFLFVPNVHASTYRTSYYLTYTSDSAWQNNYPILSGGIITTATLNTATSSTVTFNDTSFYIKNYVNLSAFEGGYVSFPFQLRFPKVSSITNSVIEGQDYCSQYICTATSSTTGTCTKYQCSTAASGQDSTVTDKEVLTPEVIIVPILYYLVDGTNYWVTCDIDNTRDSIVCPIKSQMTGVVQLRISSYVYYSSNSYQYIINLGKNVSVYTDGISEIIQNQNQNTQQITQQQQETNQQLSDLNDSINDDSSTTAQSSIGTFFENFSTNDHGLSSIITSPLSAIQSLTDSTCSPLELPLPFIPGNKKLTLPCMRPIYEQHFGAFMQLYDTITFGIVAYWVCVRIFTLVKDFKNPEHDEVEVMDL